VGRYIDSLIPALAGTSVQAHVVARTEDVEHYTALSGRPAIAARGADHGRPLRLVWEQLQLPGVLRRERPDVLHSPHYTHPVLAPALTHVPLVVTLHDATFFSDPGVHTRIKAPFFRTASRLALRRAQVCIVPSEATAGELVVHAGADRARLQVAHLGVDTALFAPPSDDAVAAVRARLGLPADRDYIAFLGTLEPRKNVPALIEGWVRAFGPGDPAAPALVIAGGAGWDETIDAAAAAVPAGLTLIRPGYLPQSELSGLLGGAAVVAYPSLGEGFGLPVVEGMACGAAVLTTNRLALGEVGGDAVAYTEPDAVSIGAALRDLIADPQRRAALGAAGRVRSAQFSWAACARAHEVAYLRAAGMKR
jgi:glycosyltransferase involved in cell wall biosynthesis